MKRKVKMKHLIACTVCVFLVGCSTNQTAQTTSAATEVRGVNLIEKKLAEAQQKGMQIIHNAALVPVGNYQPAAVTLGSETREFDGVIYVNDLANQLTIGFSQKGQEYKSGRGLAIWNDKVYCLGF